MAWTLVQYKGVYDTFYDQCDPEMRAQIDYRLAALLERGNQARKPISEALSDGLFELRARSLKVRARVLFGFMPDRQIAVVLCSFKDQRKLSKATLKLARERLKEVEADPKVLGNVT